MYSGGGRTAAGASNALMARTETEAISPARGAWCGLSPGIAIPRWTPLPPSQVRVWEQNQDDVSAPVVHRRRPFPADPNLQQIGLARGADRQPEIRRSLPHQEPQARRDKLR